VVENGRAVGIRLAGSAGTIRAREVILASGSYGSPAILLRSGIGPADELAGLGVPVTVELPGVGRNLHDHPLLRMRFATSEEPAPMWHQVMLTTRSDGASGPVDLQLFPSGPAATDDGAVLTLLVALLQPYSRGRVRLTSPAPGAALDIVPGHLSHPGDLPRIVAGMRLARQIAATSPLSDHLDEEVWPGREIVDDDALASAATSAMNTYHHAAGTCRMGPADDPGAVVDARARVHGVAGLRVVDASIMPAITRANTNLPTLGLAERAAELITDDLR
jgi:choline dehydrogenase